MSALGQKRTFTTCNSIARYRLGIETFNAVKQES
jgi:hypothetical protein